MATTGSRKSSAARGRKSCGPKASTLGPVNIESVLAGFPGGGGGGGGAGPTPLDAAQELICAAWEAPTKARRLALARQALALSPDCGDGYSILAQAAASPVEALALCREAVRAAERALGPAAFEEDVGHFWGILETRPYMRARHGLAMVLVEMGRTEEAVAEFKELLRLNPNDNQGIRYLLAARLLELGRDDDLGRLLAQYDDGTAYGCFTTALLAFRQGGPTSAAAAKLAAARRYNPHVAALLLGRRKLPKQLPRYIGMGDEAEAIAYAADYVKAWANTSGALAWLTASG